MQGQITIFDWLEPDRIDPIREVAKHAGPYWTDSRKKLIAQFREGMDVKTFARAVKQEYSPYGCNGHYGGNDEPNTMLGWDLQTSRIKTIYIDSMGERQERAYSWEDFARVVGEMIQSGEYREKQT